MSAAATSNVSSPRDAPFDTGSTWTSFFRVQRIARFLHSIARRSHRDGPTSPADTAAGAPSPPDAAGGRPSSPSRARPRSLLSLHPSSIMDAAVRAAGIVDVGNDPADQEPVRNLAKDEEGGLHRPSLSASRVSLPLSRQRSFSIAGSRAGATAPSTAHGAADADEPPADAPDELEWGPGHPCFPHANPHVPRGSPLHKSTRVIRVKRDWMVVGDLAPTFSTLYPEVLDPFVSEERFRALVRHINDTLVATFSPYAGRNVADALLGFLTGWAWEDAGLTRTKRALAQLETWIEGFNAQFADPDVRVVPLRRTAFLELDIQIPDPHLTPDDHETTEADTRSFGDGRSVRAPSLRRKYVARVSQGTGGGGRTASMTSATTSIGRTADEGSAAVQPDVPPIPGKYLAEAAQQA